MTMAHQITYGLRNASYWPEGEPGNASGAIDQLADWKTQRPEDDTIASGEVPRFADGTGRLLDGSGMVADSGGNVTTAANFAIAGDLIVVGTISGTFSILLATTAKTANYTATSSDDVIEVDASSGEVTITLPSAGTSGKRLYVTKTDSSANHVVVARAGSDTINGATSFAITTQYDSAIFISRSTGTSWGIF